MSVGSGEVADRPVIRRVETDIGDVGRIMTELGQVSGQCCRELVIDEKTQADWSTP